MRCEKQKPSKDFQSLHSQVTLQKFDKAVLAKAAELQFNAQADTTTQMYDKLCTAIHHAIDTVLPERVMRKRIKREVSEKTKSLYDKRTNTRGRGTKEEYDNVQENIKKSSLADFESWVSEWAAKMDKANGVGDTKQVYEGVNALAEKREKPSPRRT